MLIILNMEHLKSAIKTIITLAFISSVKVDYEEA